MTDRLVICGGVALRHASEARTAGDIRSFAIQFKPLDATLGKSFQCAGRKFVQIRFESFTATNRVTFGIASQANTPRIETGLKLLS